MNEGFVYKQWYASRNRSYTKSWNVQHLEYIATRPGAVYNEGCVAHGLWGNLLSAEIGDDACNINNLSAAKDLIKEISKNKTVYRGVLSLSEEDANSKGYQDRDNWQKLITQNISIIAKENDIDIKNMRWCASFHQETSHPHIHLMFYDASDDIRNEYVPPGKFEMQMEKIRSEFSKLVFTDELKAINFEIKDMQQSIKKSFGGALAYNTLIDNNMSADDVLSKLGIESKLNMPVRFSKEIVNLETKHLQNIIDVLPKQGRLNYQFLSENIKAVVDDMTESILTNCFNKEYEKYLSASRKRSKLYGNSEKSQILGENKAKKELYKLCGNQILAHIKDKNLLSVSKSDDSFDSLKNDLLQKAQNAGLNFSQNIKNAENCDASFDKAIQSFFAGSEIKAEKNKMKAMTDKDAGAEAYNLIQKIFINNIFENIDDADINIIDKNLDTKIKAEIDELLTDEKFDDFKSNIYSYGFARAKNKIAYDIINSDSIFQSIKDQALLLAVKDSFPETIEADNKYVAEITKQYEKEITDKILANFIADGNLSEFEFALTKSVQELILKNSADFNIGISETLKNAEAGNITADKIVSIVADSAQAIKTDKTISTFIRSYAQMNSRPITSTAEYTDELIQSIKEYKSKKENIPLKEITDVSDEDKQAFFQSKTYSKVFRDIQDKIFDSVSEENLKSSCSFFNDLIFNKAIPDAVNTVTWEHKNKPYTLNENIEKLFSKSTPENSDEEISNGNPEITDFKKVFGYFQNKVFDVNSSFINTYSQLNSRQLALTTEYTDEILQRIKEYKAKKEHLSLDDISNVSDDDKRSFFKSKIYGEIFKSIRKNVMDSLTEDNLLKMSIFYRTYIYEELPSTVKNKADDYNLIIQTTLVSDLFVERKDDIASDFIEITDKLVNEIFEVHSEVITSYADINSRRLASTAEYTDELLQNIKQYTAKKTSVSVDDVGEISDDDKRAFFKSKTYSDIFKCIKSEVLNSVSVNNLESLSIILKEDLEKSSKKLILSESENINIKISSVITSALLENIGPEANVFSEFFDSLSNDILNINPFSSVLFTYVPITARHLLNTSEYTDELIQSIKEYKSKKENIPLKEITDISDDDKLAYFSSRAYGETFKGIKKHIFNSISVDNLELISCFLKNNLEKQSFGIIETKKEQLNSAISALEFSKTSNAELIVQTINNCLNDVLKDENFSSVLFTYVPITARHLLNTSEYTDELIQSIKKHKSKKENIPLEEITDVYDDDKLAYFSSKAYGEVFKSIRNNVLDSITDTNLNNLSAFYHKYIYSKTLPKKVELQADDYNLTISTMLTSALLIEKNEDLATDFIKVTDDIINEIFEANSEVISSYAEINARHLLNTSEYTDELIQSIKKHKSKKENIEIDNIADITNEDKIAFFRSQTYGDFFKNIRNNVLDSITEANLSNLSEFYNNHLFSKKIPTDVAFQAEDYNLTISTMLTSALLIEKNEDLATDFIKATDDIINEIFEANSEVISSYAEINARHLLNTSECTDELIQSIKKHKAKKENVPIEEITDVSDDDKLAYFSSKSYGEVFKNIKNNVFDSLSADSTKTAANIFNKQISEKTEEITNSKVADLNKQIKCLFKEPNFNSSKAVEFLNNIFDDVLKNPNFSELFYIYLDIEANNLMNQTPDSKELIKAVKEHKSKKEGVPVSKTDKINDGDKKSYFKSKVYSKVVTKIKHTIAQSVQPKNRTALTDELYLDIKYRLDVSLRQCMEDNAEVKNLYNSFLSAMPSRITPFSDYITDDMKELLSEISNKVFEYADIQDLLNTYVSLKGETIDNLDLTKVAKWKSHKETESDEQIYDEKDITEEDINQFYKAKAFSEIAFDLNKSLLDMAWEDKGWRFQYVESQVSMLLSSCFRIITDVTREQQPRGSKKSLADLSKEGKKELLLKLRDSGVER